MDNLTRRAERALLGAMITNPGLPAQLDYLEVRDFADEQHRTIYRAIRSLSNTSQRTDEERRKAIIRATFPRVPDVVIAALAAACPDADHGAAYGTMVVQATLHRQAAAHAERLDANAALLGYDAARLNQADSTTRETSENLAQHLAHVATALRQHAAILVPGTNQADRASPLTVGGLTAELRHATLPSPLPQRAGRLNNPAGDQIRREEHLLSALLQNHPQARQILSFLPAAAFTQSYRQAAFRAIHALYATSRPVDELTVDWELAAREAPRPPAESGTESYITRLAYTSPGDRPPIQIAEELMACLHRRSHASRKAPGQAPARAGTNLPPVQTPPRIAAPDRGREQRM